MMIELSDTAITHWTMHSPMPDLSTTADRSKDTTSFTKIKHDQTVGKATDNKIIPMKHIRHYILLLPINRNPFFVDIFFFN